MKMNLKKILVTNENTFQCFYYKIIRRFGRISLSDLLECNQSPSGVIFLELKQENYDQVKSLLNEPTL